MSGVANLARCEILMEFDGTVHPGNHVLCVGPIESGIDLTRC